MTVVVVVVALIAVVVPLAIWQAIARGPTTDPPALTGPHGAPAPQFSLPSLSDPGATLSLTTFRGRPLVLNFWASWCTPCRTEMPLLEAAFRSGGGRFALLGIDANDTSSAARAFIARTDVTYPTVSDPGAKTATRFGLFGLPTTIFISSSGTIVGRHIGELRTATLRAALQEAYGV